MQIQSLQFRKIHLAPPEKSVLKVTGVDLFSAGDFSGGEGTEEIVLHDAVGGVYKKLVIKR